jgi:hypothetical protein
VAEFDWMKDPAFRNRIEEQVRNSAGRYGMRQYHTAIVGWIAEKIEENREVRVLSEMKQTASLRRSESDALNSVDLLLNYASENAKANDRETVTVADVQEAYRAHFCNFWPIC